MGNHTDEKFFSLEATAEYINNAKEQIYPDRTVLDIITSDIKRVTFDRDVTIRDLEGLINSNAITCQLDENKRSQISEEEIERICTTIKNRLHKYHLVSKNFSYLMMKTDEQLDKELERVKSIRRQVILIAIFIMLIIIYMVTTSMD